MDGDARARFCKLCSKVVHDTTGLTTCELERLLAAPVAPCLRVHRDRGGRVLTADRLAALAFVGLAACTGGGDTARLVDSGETASSDVVATMVSADRSSASSSSVIPELSATPTARILPPVDTHPRADAMPLGRVAVRVPDPVPEPIPAMMGGARPMPLMGEPTMPKMGKIAAPKE
jgi:hypothetical protein